MDLKQFLNKKGVNTNKLEGNISQCPNQQKTLKELCKGAHNLLEIGFNAGHSSNLILESTNLDMVSFDLGYHDYLKYGKEFIDQKFPGRHLLIIGDSTKSLPNYLKQHGEKKFDILFIDGGHDYEIAKQDLENCKHFAHSNTIVIMDDVVSRKELHQHFTIGPTKVWEEAVEKNFIMTLGQEDYGRGRGMIWGRYNL